jgi:hypothetical protein
VVGGSPTWWRVLLLVALPRWGNEDSMEGSARDAAVVSSVPVMTARVAPTGAAAGCTAGINQLGVMQ